MERDSGTFATKRAYFDAFPTTFVDFKNTFGYEDTQSGETYGELYEKSLDYISEFFYLNKGINLSDFTNKVIHMCIGGEWQADGVNYLQTNIINIITSSNNTQDCYYNHFDVFQCYNDTVREALLSCLTSFSDDDVLSFWKFYLDGVEVVPINDNLYKRTMASAEQYPSLISPLEHAYTIVSQKRINQEK